MIGTLDRRRTLRRTALAFLAMASALLLASGAALLVGSGKEADAASRFKVVTRTFSNTTAIQIPNSGAANPYPTAINVGGLRRGRVLDVNLTMKNYFHGFTQDVDVELVGPRGQQATVMSDVGNFLEPTNAIVTLDDEAQIPLSPFVGILTGRFKPTNVIGSDSDAFPLPAPGASANSRLSVFDGTNPRGTWKLFVFDDTGGEEGQMTGGWSLQVKAKVRR
jgi:hypothetical protein